VFSGIAWWILVIRAAIIAITWGLICYYYEDDFVEDSSRSRILFFDPFSAFLNLIQNNSVGDSLTGISFLFSIFFLDNVCVWIILRVPGGGAK